MPRKHKLVTHLDFTVCIDHLADQVLIEEVASTLDSAVKAAFARVKSTKHVATRVSSEEVNPETGSAS